MQIGELKKCEWIECDIQNISQKNHQILDQNKTPLEI